MKKINGTRIVIFFVAVVLVIFNMSACIKSSDNMGKHTEMQEVEEIPEILVMANWDGNEEYRPCFTLGEDGSVVMTANYLEGMNDIAGKYEMLYDEGRVLKLIFTQGGYEEDIRYLVERNDEWEYFGKNEGVTRSGDSFVQKTTIDIQRKMIKEMQTPVFVPGVYKLKAGAMDWPCVVYLKEEGTGQNNFIANWTRIGEVEGTLEENKQLNFFSYDKNGYRETSGLIEYNNKEIVMTLFETTQPDLKKGKYIFEYSGTEEEEKINYNKMVLVDMQGENRVWVRRNEENELHGIYEDMLIRFNEDGMLDYWFGIPGGGETIYDGGNATYQILGGEIVIDGCEYELYAYTAGDTTMSLRAIGKTERDFSGYYVCEENEIYNFLAG